MPLAFPLLIPADCPVVLILGILVFCCLSHAESDASDHPYKEVKPIAALICPFVPQRGKYSSVVCKKKLTKDEVVFFRKVVGKDYYVQMYYDDLPIWGFIGKVDKGKLIPLSTGITFTSISSLMCFITRIVLSILARGWTRNCS
ncbi:hypothetical protein V6N13_026099 [Hibiscus sabdariffa]|uniref:Uncharacterized protein n=2 Tax=Hibiscus sabdariffa TaxID=183260 RepID=A0ABR1ZZN4_9ROSI